MADGDQTGAPAGFSDPPATDAARSPRDELLGLLRRMRRRLRGLAAGQGAVVGAAAGLLLGVPLLLLARWRGDARGTTALGLAVATGAGAALAGLVWALRRIPLQRCARVVDRAAGDDRVLVALAFVDLNGRLGGFPSPPVTTGFVRAAIDDAIARAGTVMAAPARVAPWRRPRGARVLATGALAALAAALMPWPRHAGNARATVAVARRMARPGGAIFAASDLDAEREEARAASEAARATDDQLLRSLAEELRQAIGDLARPGGDRGGALDRLAALQRRAEEAERETEGLSRGLRRAGAALKQTAATRPLAEALAAGESAAAEQAGQEMAAQAEKGNARGRAALTRAFEQAAQEAAATGGQVAERSGNGDRSRGGTAAGDQKADDGDPAQRRLQRDGSAAQAGAGDSGAAGSRERRLQRLRRDLEDTAAACRDNPQACAAQLRDRGRSLPRMEQEARGGEARRRLAEATAQLRERLQRAGRGEEGQSAEQRRQKQAQRRFARAASGQPGTNDGASVVGTLNGGDGMEDESSESSELPSRGGEETSGAGDRSGPALADGAGEASGPGGAATSSGESSPASGDGIGNQSGGAPLGRGQEAGAPRGHERQAAVRSAAGPRRSQVIEAAAARGFAKDDYRSVYQDYGAVVEESLDATAVPPGQRYLVRRYFQLIRPRAAPPAPSPAKGGSP